MALCSQKVFMWIEHSLVGAKNWSSYAHIAVFVGGDWTNQLKVTWTSRRQLALAPHGFRANIPNNMITSLFTVCAISKDLDPFVACNHHLNQISGESLQSQGKYQGKLQLLCRFLCWSRLLLLDSFSGSIGPWIVVGFNLQHLFESAFMHQPLVNGCLWKQVYTNFYNKVLMWNRASKYRLQISCMSISIIHANVLVTYI